MALSSGSTSQVTKKGEHAEQRQVKSYAKGRKAKKKLHIDQHDDE